MASVSGEGRARLRGLGAGMVGSRDPTPVPGPPGSGPLVHGQGALIHVRRGGSAIAPVHGPTLDIEVVQPARRGEAASGPWPSSGARVSGSSPRPTIHREPARSMASPRGRAGLHTLAGAQWYDGCTGGHDIVDEIRRPSRFEITLPDPTATAAPGCGSVAAGYAYAYAVPRLTQPVGDPLLESAPLTDLTIVPIRVRVAGEAPCPRVSRSRSSRPRRTSRRCRGHWTSDIGTHSAGRSRSRRDGDSNRSARRTRPASRSRTIPTRSCIRTGSLSTTCCC